MCACKKDLHDKHIGAHLCLAHVGVGIPRKLLHIIIAFTSVLCHLEGETLFSESQILSGHKARQEYVDAFPYTEGQRDNPIGSRLAIEAADEV